MTATGTRDPAPIVAAFRAMATDVTIRVVRPAPGAADAVADVIDMFARVEAECTRFDPQSDLMHANAAADDWAAVGPWCFAAVTAAARAHARTRGLFDPRVLNALCSLGYNASLPFEAGTVSVARPAMRAVPPDRRWDPRLDETRSRVRIGTEPIDLGGIAKGLAVRWAGERLDGFGAAYLVEAGGDCRLGGEGADGCGWKVGVEDPRGGPEPVAVLALADTACATSSVRRRRWTVGGVPAHHLIDPRTATPGGAGLLAVTVVGPDPAEDEVWAKVLFLHGPGRIAEAAASAGVAALWVDEDGGIEMTASLRPSLLWPAAA